MDRVTSKVLFISYTNDLQDQPGNIEGLVQNSHLLDCLFQLIDPAEQLNICSFVYVRLDYPVIDLHPHCVYGRA